MYFNNRFLKHKFVSGRRKSNNINKIYVSKAEVKHTNSKAIVTIYVYNRERVALLKKILKLRKLLVKLIIVRNKLFKLFSLNSMNLGALVNNDYILKGSIKKKEYLKRLCKEISVTFIDIRRFMLKLNLNKSKFEEKFLSRLSNYISKYYGKRVEFNIVSLKSIAYNGDIFTEILTKKIKREGTSPIAKMNDLLGKVTLPEENIIRERSRVLKSVDLDFVTNKYKNINISSIINKDNLSKDSLNSLLNSLFFKSNTDNKGIVKENLDVNSDKKSYLKIRDIILDNIKYKNMGGVRLIVKGRLTRRYRADRAVYKLKWKGGLKNIDSAFRGLPGVLFRGYLDSNVEKSVLPSKRRIGTFAVKGWFSAK